MKKLFFAMVLCLGTKAVAMDATQAVLEINKSTAMTMTRTMLVDWKVGDSTTHDLKMGFIKGTMVMNVTEVSDEGIWLEQLMDLGAFGKQNSQILVDPATGEIKKIIVNGQEQQIPENNTEIVETAEETITVPAGTFDTIYVKMKDTKTGDISHAWINLESVPVTGMVKTKQPTQFGEAVLELLSFIKK